MWQYVQEAMKYSVVAVGYAAFLLLHLACLTAQPEHTSKANS